MSKLTEAQVAAVMAAILEVTGGQSLIELEKQGKAVTKEQWRAAYDIAGVPWEDYEEPKLH
jgi:hypothetical protein